MEESNWHQVNENDYPVKDKRVAAFLNDGRQEFVRFHNNLFWDDNNNIVGVVKWVDLSLLL